MAHGTIQFFSTSQEFSLEHWTLQTTGDRNFEYAEFSELGGDGDEIANAVVAGKITDSWQYLHDGTSGNLVIPNAGLVSERNWHIDVIEITWSREQMRPKLTLNAHKHQGGGGHAAGSCRQYAASIVVPRVAFGVPASFGAISLEKGATVDFRSARYRLTCSHIDENGRDGKFIAGDNHDGVETLEVEFTGTAVRNDDYSIGTGWNFTDLTNGSGNTVATSTRLSLSHHLAYVRPASQQGAATPQGGDGGSETGAGEG